MGEKYSECYTIIRNKILSRKLKETPKNFVEQRIIQKNGLSRGTPYKK